jgi:hypothetical protein
MEGCFRRHGWHQDCDFVARAVMCEPELLGRKLTMFGYWGLSGHEIYPISALRHKRSLANFITPHRRVRALAIDSPVN